MNELKPTPLSKLYDADFYAWSSEQAQRLRLLKPAGLDWENVAEEIESLGKSDRRAVASNLQVILEHLLKWRYQPDKRTKSWSRSIDEHRNRIDRIVADSPTLAGSAGDLLGPEYERARRAALKATGLPDRVIPEVCPFTIMQVLDPDYVP